MLEESEIEILYSTLYFAITICTMPVTLFPETSETTRLALPL